MMKHLFFILSIIILSLSCKKETDEPNKCEKETGWVLYNCSSLIETSYSLNVNIINKENILMCGSHFSLYNLNANDRSSEYIKLNNTYYDEGFNFFYDIFSINNKVWTVGSTCIYGSIDNGKNWTKIFQNNDIAFIGVFFLDENNGFVVGRNTNTNINDAVIYKTTNGGICWENIFKLNNTNYTSIFRDIYINENGVIWVIGDKWGDNVSSSTFIYTSNDTGKTWVSNDSIAALLNYPFVNKIKFIGKKGWISGYEEFIYTIDGGLTWHNINVPGTGHINDFKFVNKDVGWAACDNGVYYTTNGGLNWTKQLSPDEKQCFYGIDFLDDKFGIVTGANGAVFITENGGL